MLKRNYIGIDISPEYCKIAEERLRAVDTGVPVKEARAGQKALFE
jgi:DNA modification methylase